MKWKSEPTPILTSGAYEITKKAYHADPCLEPSLSRSVVVKMIEQTPMHARLLHPRLNPNYESENNMAFDLGKATEDLIFSGDKNIEVIRGFDDWRKNDAKSGRDRAYAMGKTPLLEHQYNDVVECVKSVKASIDKLPNSIFKQGKAEVSYVWQEEGIWCRTRPDWSEADGWLSDFKTTGFGGPADWEDSSYAHGYDIQAYMGLRGYFKATGNHAKGFRFVIAEIKAPFAVYYAEYTPEMLAQAEEKFHIAVKIFGDCLKSNEWPGYPADAYHMKPTYKSNKLYARALELRERLLAEERNAF